MRWYGPLAVSNLAAIKRGEHPLDEYVEKDEKKRKHVDFDSLPKESAILAEAIENWIKSLDARPPVSESEKALGANA